tara:strand:- start:271 stop:483 length:213 start_codon:yes stop_codon:yes gene_type:complete
MTDKEYGEWMTKLKRVQKENEKLRHNYDILKREADLYERQAKRFAAQLDAVEKELAQAKAELKLWMGTGV